MNEIKEDIPESRWTKKALLEREKRYRRLLDNSPDIIFRMSLPDRKFEYVSPIAEQITGYPPEDYYSHGGLLEKLFHPDWQEYFKKEWKALLKGKVSPSYEYQIIDRFGKSRWLRQTNMLVTDEGGHPVAVEGIITDITERKQAEEALRESEENYRSLAEQVHDGIYIYQGDHFLFTNNHVSEISGYSKEELRAIHFIDLVHPDDRAYIKDLAERRLRGEPVPERYGCRFIRKDGAVRDLEAVVSAIHYKGGYAALGAAQDITERRRVEDALRENEQKISLVMDGVPALLAYVDKDMRFVYVNKAYADWYGRTREDIIGKQIRDLLDDDVFACSLPNYQKVLCGIPVWYENRTVDKEGRERFLSVRLIPDSRNNEVAGWFAAVTDITEQKQVEQALQQSNRQLNLLSGITRHDIMNKITTILGYLSLAEMEFKNPLVLEYLSSIELATRAIRSQIEFTKIYENLGTHEPQWQDLDIIIALSPHLPSAIRLNLEVKGIEVFADPMLERVFFNILDNAVRHGVHVSEIRVYSYLYEDFLTIVWEENGMGIPADEKEKIFERGFGKNTGMGLFLSREVLLLTGITIKETGEPGKGVRFEITVPKGMYRVPT